MDGVEVLATPIQHAFQPPYLEAMHLFYYIGLVNGHRG